MGFNHYLIPEPDAFYSCIERTGASNFVAIKKIDAVSGNPKSIKMLDEVYELVKQKKTDSEVLETLKQFI
jgi:hypothetical protein